MGYAVLVAALVAADQLVKYLVRANIPEMGSSPLLPRVLELTYFKNTGAGFSLLTGHTWFLTLVSAVLSILLAAALWRGLFRRPAGRVALAVLLAGAVGNLIDRAAFGFVTDMFRTLFIDFPVFNVADICITLGGIAAAVYYLFFYDKLEGKRHDHPDADG